MSSYSFNGFTYIETLNDYQLIELPESMLLDKTPTSESVLFRLLLGSLTFKKDSDSVIINQSISYTKITDEFLDSDSDNVLKSWLTDGFGINDLDVYFMKNRRNRILFDELLTEFSWYFLYKNNETYVSAFLHLYRALEYMSYSFPMTYSSMTTNFYYSFDAFKGFFVNKEQGQLKFFQEFIKSLFDESILDSITKIDTFVGDELLNKKKAAIIRKLCSDFPVSDNGLVISIEYKYLLELMINLRNRYFHFQSDRKDNISNVNFNSELFFKSMNDKFANWLSMIYLEILTHGVYKLNLLPVE